MTKRTRPFNRCTSLLVALVLVLCMAGAYSLPASAAGPFDDAIPVEPSNYAEAELGQTFEKKYYFDLHTTSLVTINLSCPPTSGPDDGSTGYTAMLYLRDEYNGHIGHYLMTGSNAENWMVVHNKSHSNAFSYYKLQPGRYYITMYTNDRRSVYNFPKAMFTFASSPITDDTYGEPNDSYGEAKTITLGETLVGNVGYQGKPRPGSNATIRDTDDYYQIEVTGQTNVALDFECTASGMDDSYGERGFSVHVLNDEGSRRERWYSETLKSTGSISFILPALRPGKHYIRVSSSYETEYTIQTREMAGHTVMLNLLRDGKPYTDHGLKFRFGDGAYECSVDGSTVTVPGVLDGSYRLYQDNYDLGEVTVDGNDVTQDVNFYTMSWSRDLAGKTTSATNIASTYVLGGQSFNVKSGSAYPAGGTLAIEYRAFGAGWYTYAWSGEIPGNTGTDGNILTIENVSSTINANCVITGYDEAPEPQKYAITIDPDIENGVVTVEGNLSEAPEGEAILLIITPDEGYRLVDGSLKYNTTPISGAGFTMPDTDVTIYAEFEPLPRTPGFSPASISVPEGESAEFTIDLGAGSGAAELATVTSSDPDIASTDVSMVTISGTQVTVTGHKAGTTTITLGWSGGERDGQSDTIEVVVTETASVLESIEITNLPVKTEYIAGEMLDLTDLAVMAVYTNGERVPVTDYTTTPVAGTVLGMDDTTVVVSYSDGTSTAQTEFVITVQAVPVTLTGIEVTALPRKSSYNRGERLALGGLAVTAHYSDGSSKEAIGYTASPSNGTVLSSSGTRTVTVRYTEEGVVQTTTFTVEVKTPSSTGEQIAAVVRTVVNTVISWLSRLFG